MSETPSKTPLSQIVQEQAKNKWGVFAAALGCLQLVVHASWLIFAAVLGDAGNLAAGAWQYWVILILMTVGVFMTASGLFASLTALRKGPPKTLAVIGFCLCFFVGALSTSMVTIGYLTAK